LNTTYSRSFVPSLAWFYFKNSDCVYARKRGVEGFEKEIKMSREEKVKRKICVWKRKKK
jgi:hypothetical protein